MCNEERAAALLRQRLSVMKLDDQTLHILSSMFNLIPFTQQISSAAIISQVCMINTCLYLGLFVVKYLLFKHFFHAVHRFSPVPVLLGRSQLAAPMQGDVIRSVL